LDGFPKCDLIGWLVEETWCQRVGGGWGKGEGEKRRENIELIFLLEIFEVVFELLLASTSE